MKYFCGAQIGWISGLAMTVFKYEIVPWYIYSRICRSGFVEFWIVSTN